MYVGRLSYRASERDLEYFFRGYGKIYEVSEGGGIVMDKSGGSVWMQMIIKPGYAFVEFRDARDADDAVHDLNGKDLKGERVRLEMARSTPHGSDLYRDQNKGYRSSRGDAGNEKTDYRLIVENLSSRVSWQVCCLVPCTTPPSCLASHSSREVGLTRFVPDAEWRTSVKEWCQGSRSGASASLGQGAAHPFLPLPLALNGLQLRRHTAIRQDSGQSGQLLGSNILAPLLPSSLSPVNVPTTPYWARWARARSRKTAPICPSPNRNACSHSNSHPTLSLLPHPRVDSFLGLQDLKDFFRQVGEVTYADAHTQRKGEG